MRTRRSASAPAASRRPQRGAARGRGPRRRHAGIPARGRGCARWVGDGVRREEMWAAPRATEFAGRLEPEVCQAAWVMFPGQSAGTRRPPSTPPVAGGGGGLVAFAGGFRGEGDVFGRERGGERGGGAPDRRPRPTEWRQQRTSSSRQRQHPRLHGGAGGGGLLLHVGGVGNGLSSSTSLAPATATACASASRVTDFFLCAHRCPYTRPAFSRPQTFN